ncbi:MAG: hypothetical protein KDE53_05370, partial [Caldilineaceae bacterium]|nr:hypothetical protein [Caldilineaceae bacterium]
MALFIPGFTSGLVSDNVFANRCGEKKLDVRFSLLPMNRGEQRAIPRFIGKSFTTDIERYWSINDSVVALEQ